jgi:hypothetical protein
VLEVVCGAPGARDEVVSPAVSLAQPAMRLVMAIAVMS